MNYPQTHFNELSLGLCQTNQSQLRIKFEIASRGARGFFTKMICHSFFWLRQNRSVTPPIPTPALPP